MKNIYDYFDINWGATSDNIRSIIHDDTPYFVIARSMAVTEQTIYNWCNNKSKPSLNKLILLAKIFNVGFFDIVVLNGELEGPINEKDFNEFREKAEKASAKQLLYGERTDYQFNNKEEILANMIFNEYNQANSPITNLNEFLLYLPLVDLYKLGDVLNRTNEQIGKDNRYVLKNLTFLYNQIPNDKAKDYADFYKKYILTFPSIENVKDESTLGIRHEKLRDGLNIIHSEDFSEMYEAYQKKLKIFTNKLK